MLRDKVISLWLPLACAVAVGSLILCAVFHAQGVSYREERDKAQGQLYQAYIDLSECRGSLDFMNKQTAVYYAYTWNLLTPVQRDSVTTALKATIEEQQDTTGVSGQ